MKTLKKYGDMFGKIAEQMNEDFKDMTIDELQQIARDSKAVNATNCSWTEFRIAQTALEYALEEIEKKQKQKRKA